MFLLEWMAEVFRELARFYGENLSFGGPARRMERQLRLMYGQGEIDAAAFFRMRDSLEKGYYIEGELQTAHRQGQQRLLREGRYLGARFDAQVGRGLETVYVNRARLDEVRQEMNQALRTMEAQRVWIAAQAEEIHASAQLALPDEPAARAYLEIRQDLLERLSALESRAQMVRQNLRQLDMLKAELGVHEAELMLVDSQEHYASVKLALHD